MSTVTNMPDDVGVWKETELSDDEDGDNEDGRRGRAGKRWSDEPEKIAPAATKVCIHATCRLV